MVQNFLATSVSNAPEIQFVSGGRMPDVDDRGEQEA
jgi:hypothetical protein